MSDPEKTSTAYVPSMRELLFEAPPYRRFSMSDTEQSQALEQQLKGGHLQFDAYCVNCKSDSIFKTRRTRTTIGRTVQGDSIHVVNDIYCVVLYCERAIGHSMAFFFRVISKKLIQKIGQIPSLSDIASPELERYRKVLEPEYFAELQTAVRLASADVGIGAFVYLRRIFERLIHTHHESLLSEGRAVDGFDALSMNERIEALSSVLPAALVEHKAAYGVLSVGIHQLDEDTCRRYFPALKAAIISILEQDRQEREKKRAEEALRVEMARIQSEVGEVVKASKPKTAKS